MYKYQQKIIKDIKPIRIVVKSRQVGISSLIAAEAITDSIRNNEHTTLFISASERQSKHLLDYARQAYHQLPSTLKKIIPLQTESKQELTFSNESKIYSFPCTSSTIRGFRAHHVVLDEFAHFQNDREVYEAILPSISRGGKLTVISTPFGRNNLFYELYEKAKNKEKGHSLHVIPWTACPHLHANIQLVKKSLTQEAFSQEYECAFLDEATAYFPLSLIMQCVQPDRTPSEPGVFYMGMDIGRTHDNTVITVILEKENGALSLVRQEVLHAKPFQEQVQAAENLWQAYKPERFLVDATGMGAPVLEELEKTTNAEGVTFTNEKKQALLANLRKHFEDKALVIPRDENLINELQSIERLVKGDKITFNVRATTHHADRVISLALAVEAARSPETAGVTAQVF